MIFIKNIVFKFAIFLLLFFIFNLNEIDSNSDLKTLYNVDDIYEENYYTIYFKNINSHKLNNILKENNIKVLSYIINDKKYYAKNINELIEKFSNNLSLEEQIINNINGIKIDGITTRCQVFQIINLEKNKLIY